MHVYVFFLLGGEKSSYKKLLGIKHSLVVTATSCLATQVPWVPVFVGLPAPCSLALGARQLPKLFSELA